MNLNPESGTTLVIDSNETILDFTINMGDI